MSQTGSRRIRRLRIGIALTAVLGGVLSQVVPRTLTWTGLLPAAAYGDAYARGESDDVEAGAHARIGSPELGQALKTVAEAIRDGDASMLNRSGEGAMTPSVDASSGTENASFRRFGSSFAGSGTAMQAFGATADGASGASDVLTPAIFAHGTAPTDAYDLQTTVALTGASGGIGSAAGPSAGIPSADAAVATQAPSVPDSTSTLWLLAMTLALLFSVQRRASMRAVGGLPGL